MLRVRPFPGPLFSSSSGATFNSAKCKDPGRYVGHVILLAPSQIVAFYKTDVQHRSLRYVQFSVRVLCCVVRQERKIRRLELAFQRGVRHSHRGNEEIRRIREGKLKRNERGMKKISIAHKGRSLGVERS